MIVVKVELWPHGMERNKKQLAEGTIINTGEGTFALGTYKSAYTVNTWDGQLELKSEITNFPRIHANVLDLIVDTLVEAQINNAWKEDEDGPE